MGHAPSPQGAPHQDVALAIPHFFEINSPFEGPTLRLQNFHHPCDKSFPGKWFANQIERARG